MDRLKILNLLKWLALPLAFTMFVGTIDSFGIIFAVAASFLAGITFSNIVKGERNRIIGSAIAKDVNDTIESLGQYKNIVEIKALSSGIVVRVYLIQGQEKIEQIKIAVERALKNNIFRENILLMQLTSMESKENLAAYRDALNRELFLAIKSIKRMGKK